MKHAFSKIISAIISVWRTWCSTFVKKHLYTKDVDADGKDELVIDLNGQSSSHNENNIFNKEDNNYDK